MDLKTMKRIAERELFRFRENQEFLLAVWSAGGDLTRVPCYLWAKAIKGARAHFAATDPVKEAFFADYYHLDRPNRKHKGRVTMTEMALLYHMSESTLHHWRNEVLTVTIMAAIQYGALKPYALGGEKS